MKNLIVELFWLSLLLTVFLIICGHLILSLVEKYDEMVDKLEKNKSQKSSFFLRPKSIQYTKIIQRKTLQTLDIFMLFTNLLVFPSGLYVFVLQKYDLAYLVISLTALYFSYKSFRSFLDWKDIIKKWSEII